MRFSPKALALALAAALTASTVAIFAAAMDLDTPPNVGGTDDIAVNHPVPKVRIRWEGIQVLGTPPRVRITQARVDFLNDDNSTANLPSGNWRVYVVTRDGDDTGGNTAAETRCGFANLSGGAGAPNNVLVNLDRQADCSAAASPPGTSARGLTRVQVVIVPQP
jgi:hypothetical protein